VFSGIVEEIGTVRRVTAGDRAALVVRCAAVLEGTRLGDSIAVNGVCLTVASLDEDTFTADVQPVTLRRSNLGSLRAGSRVNLERSVAVGQRIGGHYVQGHVDGIGRIVRREGEGSALVVHIAAPPAILSYVVERGFIAVDGASLTGAALHGNGFLVSLVYHTQQHITLSGAAVGELVNLEVDVIAKYVERLLAGGAPERDSLSVESLRRHGFV
jgi:riboflavin synthase